MSNPLYSFPVAFPGATISSGIGPRNTGIPGASTNHMGIDIAAPGGSPVVAPTDLLITFAGSRGGLGNAVIGEDSAGNQHIFGHLQDFDVASGQYIKQGGLLGGVGMTGTASGNHLHYTVKDAAGNLLSNVTNSVVNQGKKLISGEVLKYGQQIIDKGLSIIVPGYGAAKSVANTLGIGDCGIVCQIKKWFTETDFFKRAAFVVLGMILIIGAIVFFSKGEATKVLSKAIK